MVSVRMRTLPHEDSDSDVFLFLGMMFTASTLSCRSDFFDHRVANEKVSQPLYPDFDCAFAVFSLFCVGEAREGEEDFKHLTSRTSLLVRPCF